MNSERYQEKLERRRARYAELAVLAQRRADQYEKQGCCISSMIPLGQPILVGHHSERRHRKDLERIHRLTSKSLEEGKKAEYYANKAQNYGTHGISSDDPSAIGKLKEKLLKLEKWRDDCKALNKLYKKQDFEGIEKLGFSKHWIETQRLKMAGRTWELDKLIPAYEITNTGAEIRRLKKRVEELSSRATLTSTEKQIGGVKIIGNVEENRVQIIFPDKPSEEIRSKLKSYGFRWSPTSGAWQRHYSKSALYWAEALIKQL